MTTHRTPEPHVDPFPAESSRPWRRIPLEAGIAAAAFFVFCVLVAVKHVSMLEPDDYAYQASIVALSRGHLTLSTAQYHALAHQLGGIEQWTQLRNGRWMSEKNPGYPFYAVLFYWIHALRFAPLFAGGLAAGSLYLGARKWLGRWAGMWTVLAFLGSGMALAFASRATMPTFTDASFIGVGAGALVWTMLASEATSRRRTISGLAGFVALEVATSMRYTDVVMLVVALLGVAVGYKAARLTRSMVAWWLGSVVVFAAGVATFDSIFYGSPTTTGYAKGEIGFSWSAFMPNLTHMPNLLVRAVPAMVLAALAVCWMGVRAVRTARFEDTDRRRHLARRDGLVGLFLLGGWLAIWGLYLRYEWTVNQGSGPGGPRRGARFVPSGLGGGGGGGAIHLIRFYVPAIALIALLAAWLLMQLPKWLPVLAVIALSVFALGSYHSLVETGGPGQPHGLGQPGGGPSQHGSFGPPSHNSAPLGSPRGAPPNGAPTFGGPPH